MPNSGAVTMEREIAKCRVALSLIAIVSVSFDPAISPIHVAPIEALRHDWYPFAIIAAHLSYAIGVLLCVSSARLSHEWIVRLSTCLDVAFGGAIALVTEAATSPARVFFAFAVLAVACRSGFRPALVVTIASVVVYLSATLIAADASVYAMRSFYLAITGYLIGYLAQQRWNVEAQRRQNDMAAERHGIARSLHDGYVQALAGVSLRLEACRELLRRDNAHRALAELADLQTGVQREYEEVRAYVRSLVDLDARIDDTPPTPAVALRIDASFQCDGAMAEHILLIMLEGVRNARQHAGAATASVQASESAYGFHITIDDDGVGLPAGTTPWSITSRVEELGGGVAVDETRPGGRLVIEIPTP